MLLTASEGRHWRYEVCEHADGYLVQMRDLETGALDEEFSTIFRTLPVAFAYAEMSAAYERYAASELEPELEPAEDDQVGIELETTERHFVDLSDRLHDSGVNGVVVQSWERENRRNPTRLLH
ncbi:hypothetical protein [Microvirga alba]|uniref:Uncharacterized protein n=1 Tax=Microvirga alba TaxID=2791025 RepID=A0A931BMR1_9HYPH|nr:hypothetical protein [Microvirga alba]MBF9234091.1 hypothetical protein [Microvirga alba]